MSGAFRRSGALASAVFSDALRRRVAYVVLVFAAVMAAAIPSLPSYGEAIDGAIFREVSLAVAFVAAAVVTLALSANRIPGEIERRSLYTVLARGVSRVEYLLGTWLGLAAVMAAVLAALTVLTQLLGLMYYGDPMWVLWQGAAGIWMEVGVIAAFALAFTTRSGPATALVGTIALLFIAHSRATLMAEDTIGWRLYPSLDVFNVIGAVSHGPGVPVAYLAVMSLAFVAWIAALLGLASLSFSGRDL